MITGFIGKHLYLVGTFLGLFLLVGCTIFGIEMVLWLVGKTTKPVLHVNATLGFSLFGLQTLFFGILAELIVRLHKK